MFTKLTLVVGFGAGYVLGARAGRERYGQLEAKFREFAGRPGVQSATESVKETASEFAETAKATVKDKVEQVSGQISPSGQGAAATIDLDAGRTSSPRPR